MKQKNLVLMVVAVGCGLVAAFLTSQMSAKPSAAEQVEVIVASKDLPVGTMFTRDDVVGEKAVWKRKKIAKDAVMPGIVEKEEELIEKRLTRAVRAEETVNKADLTKGGIVTIPPGMHLVTLPLDVSRAAGGFAGPGSRVDVMTFVRLENKVNSMPLLVNTLVLAINGQTIYPPSGVFDSVSTVSFAADRKQGLVLELAKARGCQLSLMLRHPDHPSDNDENYDIDQVIRMLQDEKNPINLSGVGSSGDDGVRPTKPGPKGSTPPKGSSPDVPEVPAPTVKETVKVPVALVDIKAGTELTTDLIEDKDIFGWQELPANLAKDAVADLKPLVGQHLRTGLGKGQWVTKSLVGPADGKAGPVDPFNPPKGGAEKAAPVAKKTHDVAVHTASGTQVFRYEEVRPGEWKLVGEVKARKAATPSFDAPPAPQATPDKQVD